MSVWPLKDHTHCTNTLGIVRNTIVCSYVYIFEEAGESLLLVVSLSKESRIEYIK